MSPAGPCDPWNNEFSGVQRGVNLRALAQDLKRTSADVRRTLDICGRCSLNSNAREYFPGENQDGPNRIYAFFVGVSKEPGLKF